MSDNLKDIGNQIIILRKEANMSQEELASRLSVSRQAISNWERNKTQPDISTLSKLSGIFGVKVDELIRGENQMNISRAEVNVSENKETKYDIAIGLFYAVGLFLGIGFFFTVGLVFNQPLIWGASFLGGICLFLVVGLFAHAIITLKRRDK